MGKKEGKEAIGLWRNFHLELFVKITVIDFRKKALKCSPLVFQDVHFLLATGLSFLSLLPLQVYLRPLQACHLPLASLLQYRPPIHKYFIAIIHLSVSLFLVPIKNDVIQNKWPMIGQYTDYITNRIQASIHFDWPMVGQLYVIYL